MAIVGPLNLVVHASRDTSNSLRNPFFDTQRAPFTHVDQGQGQTYT